MRGALCSPYRIQRNAAFGANRRKVNEMKNVVSRAMERRLAKNGVEVIKTTSVPNEDGSFAAASIHYCIDDNGTHRIVSASDLWKIAGL